MFICNWIGNTVVSHAGSMPRDATIRALPTNAQGRPADDGLERSLDLADPASLPAILTVEEVAGLLRVGRKAVYTAIRRRKLPGVRRVGRSIRIRRDALLNWLGADDPRLSEE